MDAPLVVAAGPDEDYAQRRFALDRSRRERNGGIEEVSYAKRTAVGAKVVRRTIDVEEGILRRPGIALG